MHSIKYTFSGIDQAKPNNENENETTEKLNATMGESLTIYHESLKNVSFCAVKSPFSPGILRAQFQDDHVNAHVNVTQVLR